MSNQIEPHHVTFEQAKWLKQKGFRNNIKGGLRYEMDGSTSTNGFWDYNISKYEQWQVVEWLRVNHGIWVAILEYSINDKGVFYESVVKGMTFSGYNSPKEAYSAAFDYIRLNNLIK
jgi:hypothetical protein